MTRGAALLAAVLAAGCGADPAPPAAAPTTAPVTRGDLAATVAVNGTLTHRARADGEPYVAVNQAAGVYTRLPAPGDEVHCGDALYRVDDEPVLLLCGWIPAYRDLALGDTGADVRQLNRNLHVRGRSFTERTRRALRRLRGEDELALGDAVFLPGPVRIARVTARLGGAARAGAEVVRATSDALEVQVELDAAQQGQVRRGDRARIVLPGRRTARGRVARVGTVARTADADAGPAAATLPAAIRFDRPTAARGLASAPVRAEITTDGVRDVLSVPVIALVGRAGGGFAVEVVRGGRRRLVRVTLGLFDTAGGRVAVEGAVREGDRVVVPTP